ncbi:Beta-1,4-mannosyltransferase bre-3 [Gracilariopsis chorda]|uniref:Beta-1,4-mannosyltransferase bre-3 n=1 Tax=Gracilariopsis chorda TaxID=448386 RepID=A0A2V3II62_9FLOR|nr:Beta-1,4-mannosyltransferase bre-3 [Gracilariopsis chorda]|eukprot:PXF41795.1 Beta-1,4-mannosyltransferase bre-3 [Gracilariopsis chorda]
MYYIQQLVWPPDRLSEQNLRLWVASPYLGLIWLITLPTAFATLIGSLMFSYNTKLDDIPPTSHNVAFRIVSRGINNDVLMETIRRCQNEMSRNPMFPYLIEIVTDAEVFKAPLDPDVVHLKVPVSYHTPNHTKFKARALNYACEHSVLPGDTWVVHLDEETQPTSSGIKGIAAFVANCEHTADLKRIGQGTITYHRAWAQHPFLTLADMRRTGDDFGTFYLQHKLGFTLFGLHGAFIVCRQDAEAALGFDLGPAGSITEDAWWVLIAMKNGYRTRWIDGYLEEQSTQSIMDFLKQRRRWFYGLAKVVLQCPVSLWYRLFVGYSTFSWLIIPLVLPIQLAYMVALWVFQIPVPLSIRLLTNFVVAVSSLVYMSGLICNMREHGTKWWQVPLWTIAMLIALPFCLLLEVVSIVMAIFAGCTENGKGFHVVQKSANADKDEDEEESSSQESADEGNVDLESGQAGHVVVLGEDDDVRGVPPVPA